MVGQSLVNFLTLIPKRSPHKDTTLVDYRLVSIILPSSLYGSIVGAIVNKLVPQLISSIIITLLLGFFSVRFFLKFKDMVDKDKENKS